MNESLMPLPALIADIGGTNARFALLREDGSFGDSLSFQLADDPDFINAVAERVLPALDAKPRSALLALAGIVGGERIKITNGIWEIEPRRLKEAIGLDEILLINDFEALALALPALTGDSLLALGDGEMTPHAPKLVIGPGTGLGIAALMPLGERWVPVATEGGHMNLGPASQREFEIWPHLVPEGRRVQVESVISGPGIENLYRAVAIAGGVTPEGFSAADVVGAAAEGDPIAGEALDIFTACLGRLSGDMVLLFLARSVFVAGGIPTRIIDRLQAGHFRRAFVDKAPYRDILESIGTAVITHPEPAFLGAAEFVRHPERYAMDLRGRRWR
jgi:glucokinase